MLPLGEAVEMHDEYVEVEKVNQLGEFTVHVMLPIMVFNNDLSYVEASTDGAETPVVEWLRSDPKRDVQGETFPQWLAAHVRDVEAGRYRAAEHGLIDKDDPRY